MLAGGSHRELIVAGPDVTKVLQAEAAADSGQVVVSDATPITPQQPRGDERRLAAPRAVVDLEAGVPSQLRSYLTGSLHEGEHRLATVGFIQCRRVDDFLAEAGPGGVAAALDRVITVVDEACTAHGVTFVSTDVDKGAVKIILAAGVPSASSDDELRMVQAMTAILRAELPVPLRAGIARGRVFAVDLGSPERRTFTLIGDAVNLAARIMANAESGQVWAARDVLARYGDRVAATPLEPFAVKGKAAAVEAVAIDLHTDIKPAVVIHRPARLIGRDTELARLSSLVDAAAAGVGAIAEITGEPGIGKSTLVAAVADIARSAGLDLVRLEAGRYIQVTSYFPLRALLRQRLGLDASLDPDNLEDALRAAVAELAPSFADWYPLLGQALGYEIPDTAASARLEPALRAAQSRAVVSAVLRATLTVPTLLLVEDAHWLDTATAAVLADVAAHVSGMPWMLLTTRRPIDGGYTFDDEVAVQRLALEPITADSAAELVRATLEDHATAVTLPPGTVERLVERAAGNPLFLHELVMAAVAGELAELPDTVEAVVSASIDVLPADDRMLLRRAAVLGARFPASILSRMLGEPLDSLLVRLDGLSRFLDCDDPSTVRFRHGLLRDVAYEGLPFRRRRELHGLAGTILESSAPGSPDEIAELLSTHFHAANNSFKSWYYSRVAGERSERAAAPIEAAVFYERALEAARRLPDVAAVEQADVGTRLGDVRELSGRYAEARAAYAFARKLQAGDTLAVAELARRTGITWEREGQMVNALRAYQRARATLGDADDLPTRLMAARLSVAYGGARLRQGRYQLAQPVLEHAVELVTKSRERETYGVLAHAYRLLDWIDIELGIEREVPLRYLSLRLYDSLGDEFGRANVFNNMGIAAYYRGHWDEAADYYGRGLEAARKAGALVFQALVLNNLAEIRSDQGHLRDAEEMLREAVDIWQGAGSAMLGMGYGNLGRAAARAGRLDDAKHWYDESRRVCEGMHEATMVLETDAREAERLMLAGQSAEALAAAQDSYERALALGGNPYVLMLADRTAGYALAQQGQLRRGWSRLSRALMRSREIRTDYEAALSMQALARVGRLLGVTVAADFDERAQTFFAALGVVRTPDVPLPEGAHIDLAAHEIAVPVPAGQ
jgi:class 3 adenylate cyclase/tetratricopeptide (TPR) repeat protein